MPTPGIGLAGMARASLSGNIVFTHDQPHKVRRLHLMLHDAIICRHFTPGDGGDPLVMEFPGRTAAQSPWSRDLAQFRQIATRRGFLCRGGANASPRHKLTSIVDHLTESNVD
jgi:hypothetical protein